MRTPTLGNALRPAQAWDRQTLVAHSKTHGLAQVQPPSEDYWRSIVWHEVKAFRQRTGDGICPLTMLRQSLRFRLAAEDRRSPGQSMRYSALADEMILDAINSEDGGVAVYPLSREMRRAYE